VAVIVIVIIVVAAAAVAVVVDFSSLLLSFLFLLQAADIPNFYHTYTIITIANLLLLSLYLKLYIGIE